MKASGKAIGSAYSTDLERRVLAHERILQSLIAYMSTTEPRFVDHLRKKFVEPMKMSRHEHDYRDVDDYAEEFIRAIMLISERNKPADTVILAHIISPTAPNATHFKSDRPVLRPNRIQMKEADGIWHVIVDDAFWGDFQKKEDALAAVALAKLSLR